MTEIVTGLLVAVGGSLINFTSTRIYNFFSGKSKNFLWQNKYPQITSYKPPNDFEQLKRRARIVVVDDEDSFPVILFRNEGYSVEKWDKVIDYGKLENGHYDIIVLDIKGVATDISEEDGLGVLESIKRNNPAQIIIAYSQHSFDLSKANFWELADEKIAKPSDFLKMKKIIDNLINTQFKPSRYIDSLHLLLRKNNFSEIEIKRLDNEISKIIKKQEQPNWHKLLDFISNKPDLVKQIISIGNTIIKFF